MVFLATPSGKSVSISMGETTCQLEVCAKSRFNCIMVYLQHCRLRNCVLLPAKRSRLGSGHGAERVVKLWFYVFAGCILGRGSLSLGA